MYGSFCINRLIQLIVSISSYTVVFLSCLLYRLHYCILLEPFYRSFLQLHFWMFVWLPYFTFLGRHHFYAIVVPNNTILEAVWYLDIWRYSFLRKCIFKSSIMALDFMMFFLYTFSLHFIVEIQQKCMTTFCTNLFVYEQMYQHQRGPYWKGWVKNPRGDNCSRW